MDQRLANAAESGDIDSLYELFRDDPNVLEGIDTIPFAQTPLHIAAAAGRTHFALEIMRLKPSFSMMLNPDGLTAMDLALRNGHIETVRRLANYEPNLIRVQGREGISPLHYVAEINDADLFAEFLLTSPASIEDLTIRGETAAHIAARNGSFRVLKVLVGWLCRVERVEILNGRDEKGNTVLHIAADTNQPQVMKLLVKNVELNYRNLQGLTALDIVMKHRDGQDATTIAKNLLVKAGASKASSLPNIVSLADFLCTTEKFREKITGLSVYLSIGLSGEMRNAILVVAVLIATATFQAVLQPPGGVSQGDNSSPLIQNTTISTIIPNNNITSSNNRVKEEGTAVMSTFNLHQFFFWNTLTFAASLSIIVALLPRNRYMVLLYVILTSLLIEYFFSAMVITPKRSSATYTIVLAYLVGVFLLSSAYPRANKIRTNVTVSRRLIGSNGFHARYEMAELVSHGKYSSRNNM